MRRVINFSCQEHSKLGICSVNSSRRERQVLGEMFWSTAELWSTLKPWMGHRGGMEVERTDRDQITVYTVVQSEV